ncbi:hypothetical protein HY571_02180 [Candidatus Micrarchaeota archaeon]|nr:hypothetical protein [Candidatus Micrarchaeota archaeon]
MTVISDELIKNCRNCFFENGYGVKLHQKGDILVCSHDSKHVFEIVKGELKKR